MERLRRDSEAAIGAGNLTIPDAHRLLTHKASPPCIPSRRNRNKKLPASKRLYKMGHTVENLFAKLKDRRPIATRYHRYARNLPLCRPPGGHSHLLVMSPEPRRISMGFGQWLGLLALLAALLLLWSLKGVLLVLFGAVVLSVALNLPVRAIQGHCGWRRSWALLVVLLGLSMALLVGSVVLAPPFVKEFRELIEKLPEALNTLLALIDANYRTVILNIYGSDSELPDSLAELFRTRTDVGNALERSLQGLLGLVGNLGGGLLKVVFVLILAVMLTAQPKPYQALAIRLAPSFYRRRLQVVLSQCDSALGNWMTGLLISSFCVAGLAGIGLAVLGIKPVVANALLAGLLNVIPNIGPTVSTVFPASSALLDSPWRALAVVVLYLVIQNVESYLITPWVMHKQVKLLPGLALLSQFVFAVLLGPLGLLMALPLVVVLQVLVREVLIHDVMDRWLLGGGAAGAATAREGPED